MRTFALLAVAALAAAVPGCLEATPAAVPAPPPESQFVSDKVNVTIPLLPTDAPAPGERTLAAPPQWRLGEWWRYRMTDAFTGNTYEFLRVVAGEDRRAGDYLVGFPVEEFSNDVMIFHVPGYGDIRQSDLSYEAHDVRFQPLQFPLEHGRTWEVSFEGVADGLATVFVREDGKADIVMEVSQYGFINATYDPAVGEISRLDVKGYASYEVIDHGYGYEGDVRVPHDHDLVFLHGRILGVQDVRGTILPPTPATPEEKVEVGGTYDRLSFTIILGGGAIGVDAPAGYFAEKVTAPDGTVYELELLPSEGSMKIAFFGAELPVGTWTLEHTALGAGVAFVEGIGYHSIDIALPSGCVIESVNAGHHVAPCRTDRR